HLLLLDPSYSVFFYLFIFFITQRPPRSPLFPYTTLFRSHFHARRLRHHGVRGAGGARCQARMSRARRGGAGRRRRFRTEPGVPRDRKSTRLNSSHVAISYAVFCLKKKKYLNDKV